MLAGGVLMFIIVWGFAVLAPIVVVSLVVKSSLRREMEDERRNYESLVNRLVAENRELARRDAAARAQSYAPGAPTPAPMAESKLPPLEIVEPTPRAQNAPAPVATPDATQTAPQPEQIAPTVEIDKAPEENTPEIAAPEPTRDEQAPPPLVLNEASESQTASDPEIVLPETNASSQPKRASGVAPLPPLALGDDEIIELKAPIASPTPTTPERPDTTSASDEPTVEFIDSNEEIAPPTRVATSPGPRAPQKPNEPPATPQNAFELLVGRKVLAWVAVGLFFLGAAFFAQLAIQRGWFNPAMRCASLVALGGAFLGLGRFFYGRGLRGYSQAVTSAGVAILVAAGYYARYADVLPTTAANAIMIAAIFIGFACSCLYRGAGIALATSIVGFFTPFLLGGANDLSLQTPFLLAYFAAGLVVANVLKRSYLATLPWLGAAFAFWFALRGGSDSLDYRAFVYASCFISIFYALDTIDLVAHFFAPRRRPSIFDAFRGFATPTCFFFGFALLFRLVGKDVVVCNVPANEFFGVYGQYPAFVLTAFYAILLAAHYVNMPTLLKKRVQLDARSNVPNEPLTIRRAETASRILDLRGVFLTDVLLFAGIGTHLAASQRFGAACFATLATALIVLAARKSALTTLPSFVESLEPATLKARVIATLARSERSASLHFTFWSVVYFGFAVYGLWAENFDRNFYSLEAFVDLASDPIARKATLPFLNEIAFPTFLASLILIGASFAFAPRGRRSSEEIVELQPSLLIRFFATIYALVGAFALLLLSASEIFAFSDVVAYFAGSATPGVVGAHAVACVWALVAFGIYFAGWRLDVRGLRTVGTVLLLMLGCKLLALHLHAHPTLGEREVVPLLTPVRLASNVPRALYNAIPADQTHPLLNPFAAPFVLVSLVAWFIGVVGARFVKPSSNETEVRRVDPRDASERSGAVAIGVSGLVLFALISGLDCYGWFAFRPDRFGDGNCWPVRSVWVWFLLYALILWELGRAFKSAPLRNFAYVVLGLNLGAVAIGEFFSGDWRVNHETIEGLANPYALPALGVFLASAFLPVRDRYLFPKSRCANPGESDILRGFGAAGIAGLIALSSFEMYRYFTGKTWFGPADWTRALSLSFLWSVGIAFFFVWGSKFKSKLCYFFGTILFIILATKYLAFDLFRPFPFKWPFVNQFSIATYAIVLATFFLGRSVLRGARESLGTRGDDGARVVNLFAALFLIFAIGQVFFGTSVDVFRCARVFPAGDKVDSAFLAQTALSVLWTLWALVLLAIGFMARSALLRWLAILIFGATTFKVMTVDLTYLDSIYRVIAFFALAIALGIAAYAYNRKRAK